MEDNIDGILNAIGPIFLIKTNPVSESLSTVDFDIIDTPKPALTVVSPRLLQDGSAGNFTRSYRDTALFHPLGKIKILAHFVHKVENLVSMIKQYLPYRIKIHSGADSIKESHPKSSSNCLIWMDTDGLANLERESRLGKASLAGHLVEYPELVQFRD